MPSAQSFCGLNAFTLSNKVMLYPSADASCQNVGSHQVKSGFRRVSVGILFWHDGTRQGSMGRSSVLYRCTIDARTHAEPYGVPTHLSGPSGPNRPQRTAGGTVAARLIGASPEWAARSSYWPSRGYLYHTVTDYLGTSLKVMNLQQLCVS